MVKLKKTKKSEFLSVRVPKEVKEHLERTAASQERSLSWLVAKILEEFAAKQSAEK